MTTQASGNLQDGAEYLGIPCDPVYGKTKGRPYVHVAMQIAEGPCNGLKVKYEVKKWDEKNIPYIKRDLMNVGWKGRSMDDFVSDVNAARQAGYRVQFTARLAEHEGRTWWTAGSIGYYTPSAESADQDTTSDVDSWLGAPGASSSRTAGGSGGGDGYDRSGHDAHPNAPGPDSDIPF